MECYKGIKEVEHRKNLSMCPLFLAASEPRTRLSGEPAVQHERLTNRVIFLTTPANLRCRPTMENSEVRRDGRLMSRHSTIGVGFFEGDFLSDSHHGKSPFFTTIWGKGWILTTETIH